MPSESSGRVLVGGEKMTFNDILKMQNNFFNDYKNIIIKDIGNLRRDIRNAAEVGLNTSDLTSKHNSLIELTTNPVAINRDFDLKVAGVGIAMKYTKMGYRFLDYTGMEKGINKEHYYSHMHERFKGNAPRLIYDENTGKIKNVLNRVTDTKYRKAKFLKGREVFFAVSYTDAIVVCDYSRMIREGKVNPENVMQSLRLTKSAYEKATDHFSIPPSEFTRFVDLA